MNTKTSIFLWYDLVLIYILNKKLIFFFSIWIRYWKKTKTKFVSKDNINKNNTVPFRPCDLLWRLFWLNELWKSRRFSIRMSPVCNTSACNNGLKISYLNFYMGGSGDIPQKFLNIISKFLVLLMMKLIIVKSKFILNFLDSCKKITLNIIILIYNSVNCALTNRDGLLAKGVDSSSFASSCLMNCFAWFTNTVAVDEDIIDMSKK